MVTVIGYRDVNFKGNNGDQVCGQTIYYTVESYGCVGLAADKFFMSERKLRDIGWAPQVGDKLELYYNKYGKVSTVEIL